MKPTALVGFSGFVGGNLAAQYAFDELYDIGNIADGFDKPHSLVVYAGVPAAKFLANHDPAADADVIETAKENLRRLCPERVILISTADVYRDPDGVDEDSDMQKQSLQAYGADRLELEEWVCATFENSLVVRLPALFGPGLKKNFIYDMIHIVPSMLREEKYALLSKQSPLVGRCYAAGENGFYKLKKLDAPTLHSLRDFFAGNDFNALSFTDSRASYQFYSLKNLWRDVQSAADAGLRLVNITSEPMTAAEVFFAVRGKPFTNQLPGTPVHYNIKTLHCDIMGGENGYVYSRAQILPALKEFICTSQQAL